MTSTFPLYFFDEHYVWRISKAWIDRGVNRKLLLHFFSSLNCVVPWAHQESYHDNMKMLLKLIFKASHEHHRKFLFSAVCHFSYFLIITMHISSSSLFYIHWLHDSYVFFCVRIFWGVVDLLMLENVMTSSLFHLCCSSTQSRCWVSLF